MRDKAGFRRFFQYLEETGLVDPLREICVEHAVTLFEVYGDSQGPTTHAARLECWAWLHLYLGKSAGEVARLFDREHTSVLYAFRRFRDVAKDQGIEFALSTIRTIAVTLATKTAASRSASGRRVAAIRNANRRCPDCRALLHVPVHAHCPSQNAPKTPPGTHPVGQDPSGGESAS